MPHVRLREKHQITLPVSVVRDANIATNDTLEVGYKNGVITLIPSKPERKASSLMSLMGSARGLYGNTPAEIDAYLVTERASWES